MLKEDPNIIYTPVYILKDIYCSLVLAKLQFWRV